MKISLIFFFFLLTSNSSYSQHCPYDMQSVIVLKLKGRDIEKLVSENKVSVNIKGFKEFKSGEILNHFFKNYHNEKIEMLKSDYWQLRFGTLEMNLWLKKQERILISFHNGLNEINKEYSINEFKELLQARCVANKNLWSKEGNLKYLTFKI